MQGSTGNTLAHQTQPCILLDHRPAERALDLDHGCLDQHERFAYMSNSFAGSDQSGSARPSTSLQASQPLCTQELVGCDHLGHVHQDETQKPGGNDSILHCTASRAVSCSSFNGSRRFNTDLLRAHKNRVCGSNYLPGHLKCSRARTADACDSSHTKGDACMQAVHVNDTKSAYSARVHGKACRTTPGPSELCQGRRRRKDEASRNRRRRGGRGPGLAIDRHMNGRRDDPENPRASWEEQFPVLSACPARGNAIAATQGTACAQPCLQVNFAAAAKAQSGRCTGQRHCSARSQVDVGVHQRPPDSKSCADIITLRKGSATTLTQHLSTGTAYKSRNRNDVQSRYASE